MGHLANVVVVLIYELVNLAEVRGKWPIAQLRDVTSFYFVNCQELVIVLFVGFEETSLADQSRWVTTGRTYANVDDITTLMAL